MPDRLMAFDVNITTEIDIDVAVLATVLLFNRGTSRAASIFTSEIPKRSAFPA